MPAKKTPSDVLPEKPIAKRFVEERRALGYETAYALAVALNTMPSTISRTESGWSLPGSELLARFAALGADIQYVLTGTRSKPLQVLQIIFGTSLPHQEVIHLLGASQCLLNGAAEYTPDLNPYPPSSPHHAGVEIGWRMARAAITGETTVLPGTL